MQTRKIEQRTWISSSQLQKFRFLMRQIFIFRILIQTLDILYKSVKSAEYHAQTCNVVYKHLMQVIQGASFNSCMNWSLRVKRSNSKRQYILPLDPSWQKHTGKQESENEVSSSFQSLKQYLIQFYCSTWITI